jgi:hypothetical protein
MGVESLSAVEIAISVGSAAAGVAAGSLAVYFSSRKPGDKQISQVPSDPGIPEKPTPQAETSIPKEQLDKSKRELRTLQLEKELVSAALTRLYEAEAAREITREEREILGAKYKTELGSLDERIAKVDAFIQIGDLETLRNQLMQLVTQKMKAIERRIENTKLIAEPLIAEMLNKTPITKQPKPVEERARVPDISDMLEKPETTPLIAEEKVEPQPALIRNAEPRLVSTDQNFASRKSGEKVEELQKELLEALDRLEKLDVES